MTLTERERRIVELTKRLVGSRIEKLPQGFMSCGFLWGYVTIRRAQKNGKVRTFDVKTCFGSYTPASWTDAENAARTVADVHITHVNMD